MHYALFSNEGNLLSIGELAEKPLSKREGYVLAPEIVYYQFGFFVIALNVRHSEILLLKKEYYKKYVVYKSDVVPVSLIDHGLFIKQTVPFEEKVSQVINDIHYFKNIYVNLSTKCNLNCTYCYAYPKTNEIANLDMIKAAIDLAVPYNRDSLEVRFLSGGEHTLAFKKMKQIVNYAKKKVPKVSVHLATNGVFSDEVLKWIEKNVTRVQLSCDGPPEIQDKNRPLINGKPSSQIVERTIKKFVADNIPIALKAVFGPDSIGKELMILDYFNKLGVRKIGTAPMEISGKATENEDFCKFEFIKHFDYLMRFKEICDELGIVNSISTKLLFGTPLRRCGVFGDYFVLSPEGLVAGCPGFYSRQALKHESMTALLIGNYNKKTKTFDMNWNRIHEIQNTLYKLHSCKKCELLYVCTGDCVKSNYASSGKYEKPQKTSCERIKRDLKTHVEYLVNRNLIRLKPCLLNKNGNFVYSLEYTDFPLTICNNPKKLKDNPHILIDTQQINLSELAQHIVAHNLKQKKLTFFLLDFHLSPKELDRSTGKKILSMFDVLNKNHIYYRGRNFLPPCLFENYETVLKKYNLPKNVCESLEFYTVLQSGRLILYDGTKSMKRFSEYIDRNEIWEERNKSSINTAVHEVCEWCAYKIRKRCNGWHVTKNL